MKQVNKAGPELVRNLAPVKALTPDLLPAIARQGLTIDVSPAADFAATHVPGTVNVPLNMLVQWAGFHVDDDQPLHLSAEPSTLPVILKRLRSIGICHSHGHYGHGGYRW